MAHSISVEEIKNPGKLVMPKALALLLLAFTAVGLIAFVVGLKQDAHRAWASFLVGHFFFFSLALGGLFFAAIQWVSGAMWSAPIRRVAESFTPYLGVALVTFLVISFGGMHDLYHWAHPDAVAHDPVLLGKSGYLNTGFFVVRNLVAFAIWIFFLVKLIGNSLKQDRSGDHRLTMTNRSWTPVFLILFALTYTMSSFDLLMSLDPHWYSTMYGVYTFAGLFYTTLAAVTVGSILLKRAGYLEGIVNANHLHDLGKFMFAFTVFWAYIGFSQFMLIWYANLPEETVWYLRRMDGGWLNFSIFLFVGKFVIPFFVLLPRSHKRSEGVLLATGIWMILMQFVDLYWLVQPEIFPAGPMISWMEIVIPLGFLGVFGLMTLFFLSRQNVVAIGDPRLSEAVYHHHV